MRWRLIIHPKLDPYYNMAVDEALLESCIITREPVLRFYDWEESSVSIGYFQSARAVEKTMKFVDKLKIVRRPTGGGAVTHGEDITFSISFPERLLAGPVLESYHAINKSIIANMANNEHFSLVKTEYFSHEKQQSSRDCFRSPTKYDIMWLDEKIGGSAQRRKNGVILHQSSFFFKKCLDLTEHDSGVLSVNRTMFIELIEKAVIDLFKVRFYLSELSSMEKMLANDFYTARYSTKEWNYAR